MRAQTKSTMVLFQTKIRTCCIQKIHLDTLGSLRGFGCPNGRKKLVTYPRNLPLRVLVIGCLQILDRRLVRHLRRRWVSEILMKCSEACLSSQKNTQQL